MIEAGTFIADRYEILQKIGAGGMSDVYKAKDQVLGRFVAVKVLKQEFTEDVNFVSKFHAEAQAAAGLQHPNIVNIYDVGSEEHMHFIVMEYVEGITLKTYIEKKGQLNYKEAISIAIQVARGIEAAHNNGIVHRDIKPQNIMISNEGKVKVTDFGIARAASSKTLHSDVMGSVHYSSPEQARNGFVDGKSDIYSLGIVMYEMVTGRVPFDGDTTVAIAIQHLQEDMVPPSNYTSDLPVSLEKIILKCTQKNQDRRYLTMGDLLTDLKHALMSPNDDFVVIESAVSQAKTTVIGAQDLQNIKNHSISQNSVKEEASVVSPVAAREEEEEDDDGGFLNPKMEKAVTILGIVTGVIIILIILYLILNLAGVIGGARQAEPPVEDDTEVVEEVTDQIEMIDLKGMTFDQAKEELKALGIGIFQEGAESSDEYEEGQIISQDIEEGRIVEANTTVKVIVSSGKGEFAVPNVTGYADTAAIGMLDDAKLKYNREYESSDTVAEGTVIRQEPAAGTMAKEGDTVTIIVSQGKEAVQVPDLKNHTQEEAQQLLADKGLVVGTINSDYSDTVPEGSVIDQSEQAGKTVYTGTTVNFTVSLGKKEILYRFSGNIRLPNDDSVSYANIYLENESGDTLSSWEGIDAEQFPFAVDAENLTSSSGTLIIEWVLEDEEGNITTSVQKAPQTFRQQ